MTRSMMGRALALLFFAAVAPPAPAAEVYQISTISSLLAGGYDGDTTVGELLHHGNFGLGTFNGVDGEMMVLDGKVYRGTVDGRAQLVASSELTPFAVVVTLRPRPQAFSPVAAGQSLEQLEAALDALPYSASRVLAARVDGQFRAITIRSEPNRELRQCAGLAFPLSDCRQDTRRPCARSDHGLGLGLARGILGAAHPLSGEGPRGERRGR